MSKPYFHELPQSEIDIIIAEKKTVEYVLKTYRQPKWCNYPEALGGILGCWSLMDLSKDGFRTKICPEFCKTCEESSLHSKQ